MVVVCFDKKTDKTSCLGDILEKNQDKSFINQLVTLCYSFMSRRTDLE